MGPNWLNRGLANEGKALTRIIVDGLAATGSHTLNAERLGFRGEALVKPE